MLEFALSLELVLLYKCNEGEYAIDWQLSLKKHMCSPPTFVLLGGDNS